MCEIERESKFQKLVETIRAAKRDRELKSRTRWQNLTDDQRRTEVEQRWRAAEVFGLWAAALVGLLAIASSTQDASEQRQALRDQLSEMTRQRLASTEQMRANLDIAGANLEAITDKHNYYPIGPTGLMIPPDQHLVGFRMTPVVGNTGQTDARNVEMFWSLLRVKGTRSERKPANCPVPQMQAGSFSQGTIPPRIPQQSAMMDPLEISLDDVRKAFGDDSVINFYAVGHIEYRDVFPADKPAKSDGSVDPETLGRLHHLDWCKAIVPADIDRGFFKPIEMKSQTD